MNQSGAKVGVVLSGGGAFGAFEVGVLKALCGGKCPTTGNQPLEVDVFTGTSVGSFNATVMSMKSGLGPASAVQHLEHLWLREICDCPGDDRGNSVFRLRGNPVHYIDFPLSAAGRVLAETMRDARDFSLELFRRLGSTLSASGSLSRRALGLIDLAAFISVEPFLRLLKRNLDLDAVRKSTAELRIVLTDWANGSPRIFTNADMTDREGHLAVLASSAIPGLFPPVEIGRRAYVDGGVIENTPLNFAIEAGATELHVIYLDPDVSAIPLPRIANTIDTFSRAYSIMLAISINEDIKTAAWINDGLETLEKAHAQVPLTPADEFSFIRVAARLAQNVQGKYRKLTIHRYRPSEDLGGFIGMLNFTETTVKRLIRSGYESGLKHNCATDGCLIPKEAGRAAHQTAG